MNRYLSITLLSIAILYGNSGCNHEKPYKIDDPSQLLPENPNNPAQPPYSFAPELENPDTRYVSKKMTMRYSSGGILVAKSETTITMTDLALGNRIEFSGSINKTGIIDNPTLVLNDSPVTITKATVEYIDKKGTWIHVQAPDDDHIVIVISDL